MRKLGLRQTEQAIQSIVTVRGAARAQARPC